MKRHLLTTFALVSMPYVVLFIGVVAFVFFVGYAAFEVSKCF